MPTLFKTTNGGSTYTPYQVAAEEGTGYAVAIDPNNDNIIYMGGYSIVGGNYRGCVFKTDNGGSSWQKVWEDYPWVYAIAVDPVSTNKVYFGTYAGLHKSESAGQSGTWTKVDIYDVNCIKLNPAAPSEILTGGYNGVRHSADGGLSWEDWNNGFPCRIDIRSLDYDPANGILYAGTEGFSVYRCSSGSSLPSVTTSAVGNITTNSAVGGGNVTSDGGSAVTERGACWSTSANPTTGNSHTHDGSGTGSFSSQMNGLASGTLYHVRAYATNSSGTAYGNDVSFTTLTSGTATPRFLIPFGSLDNGNINLGNIGTGTANVVLKVLDAAGATKKEQGFTIPVMGVKRSWDVVGNIFDYGKPVTVEVSSDQPLAGDNIKWAGPPYDTVGAGFTCGPLNLAKGRLFYFPFTSFGGQANGYCVIANTTTATANVTIEVYDTNGALKKSAGFSIGPKGVVRSWDYIGSIQEAADPAHLKVVSDQDVVVEAVRWEQNRRGWGFAIFPSAIGGGTSFVIPFGSLDNGNINLANISGGTSGVTLRVLASNGATLKQQSFSIPQRGVVRSWDIVGNIFNYGKPVTVEVESGDPIIGDNIKWAGPPYDTVGAGFTCAPLSFAKGKLFYFPFSSFGGQANGYCVIANTTTTTANVTIEVYDTNGTLKTTSSFSIGEKAVIRSWDYIGSIQAIADPALLKVTSSQAVVIEAVRWEQNRRGWGFAILPTAQ